MRTKAEQIAGIKADQQFWRNLAAEVGAERYGEPGPMGDWSFGDMAGHLGGWRNRTLARLSALARGEPNAPNPWPGELGDDIERINDWIHDQGAGRNPAELVADYDASYDRLIRELDALPESTLTDPTAVEWSDGTALVDYPFTGHLHDEHLESVRAWLDGQRGA
jgi:uncharacterized protein (TIGR03083 family)